MAERYFDLNKEDQNEVLEQARARTGRPAHLLEKDLWVVWTLGVLFESPFAADLTFKGGTSLSKAYKIIERFSEDIDLTYDIRKLIADLTGDEYFLPASRSQASKWSKAVRDRLPDWIGSAVQPHLQAALERERLGAKLEIAGAEHDTLQLHYPAIKQGTGYVSPVITLEFGGRATGEPHGVLPVTCDMAGHVDGVSFPQAFPQVMGVARTFWEKATATHVYCAQGRIRGERYARHWHDLAAIMRSEHFDAVIADRAVAREVAEHKSWFFSEKAADNKTINYTFAVLGALRIVPEGGARDALAAAYAKMLEDEVMVGDALPFDQLMQACAQVQALANAAART
ncbi:MAG: nucleotidyl transferase AbiEii/AbiGii toxin family protein [Burkholderiales bacterium]|uniref:nucleotidyl transferase AbiEii/AbiGii toxin family protein n=1 Tax=Hydrogenophaga sp. TaxID=1904254 RepID=UPI00271634AA|nr:nucleotidyl transferase AbiEii/AbiGii toxin family protein [Hydrogenophaga sp.]MDO9505512.1 nucleotidyl transferase AbiEii/AbiGii toxin family protein [Hydrogenophaga sp.]MDZ4145105.1 nucleotidyl transferase AbiEii/AbiGii toxin family protein [Burkholderiales bacterium]